MNTGGAVRSYVRLAGDLSWVAVSPLLALLIRDNFCFSVPRAKAIILYSLLCIFTASFVCFVARLHRRMWRYVSLSDSLHLVTVVSIALLLALLTGFLWNRLEPVARSLPVIQWLLLIAGMIGTRIAIRLLGERND